MNEQAIQDAYNLFVQSGYGKSIDEFKQLMASNPEALNDSYNQFVSTGYRKSIDDFRVLIGANEAPTPMSTEPVNQNPVQAATDAVSAALKKKEGSASMASPSAGSSSGLPQQQKIDLKNIEIAPSATGEKQVVFPAIKDIDFAGMVQKKEEEEADKPEFYKTAMGTITPDLIDTKEEYAVPQLNYQFGPMGFKFEEYAPGDDYMLVTAPNDEKHYVNLFAGANSKSEAEKLKKFIDQNTNVTGLKSLERQYSNENKKILNDQQVDTEFKSLEEKVTVFKNDITSFLGEKQRLEAEKSAIESVPEKDRNTVEYKKRKLNLDSDLTTFEQRGSELLSRESEMQVSAKNLEKAVGKYTEMKASQGTVVGGALNALLTGQGTQSSGAVGAAIDIAFSKYVAGIDQSDIEKQITDAVATGDPEEDKKTSAALSAAYRINQTNKDYQDKYNQEIEDQRAKGVKEELMVAPIAPKYMSANIPMPAKGQTERDWYNSLTEDQKTALVDKSNDDIKKDLKKSVLPAFRDGLRIVVGDDNTTTQWTELKKQGFWGGALLGVTESLPAMVGSNSTMGWAQRTAQMYAQTTDAVYKEMENDPNFANVSESEKLSVVAPIGIATAVLETMGLRNIVANKGVMNRIVLSAMGRAGATTTAKTFGELVKNEVNSMLGKGLLTLTGAALAEAETGAAQQAAEYYYKDIYNKAKEKEMFQTPEFLSADYIKDVAKAGAQEAVGGFVLGMPKAIAVAHAKRGYLSMDDGTFKMFEAAANDSKIQRAYVISLKQDVSMGKITWQEAKESLDDYRSSVGLFRSIPEGLTTKGKKEAMNLLQEKKTLEQQIDGKEESLVRKQKDRIKEIEAELNELTNEPASPEMPTPTEATGNKIQVLTDEEEKRRLDLEEAIKGTIRTNPDELSPISVSIADETISVEDAKKELQILNEKANAVQEPSTESVLPREQGEATETGGQREGMGQGVQGQESTQEGTQEKVEQPEEGFVLKGRNKGYHEYTYNGTNVTLEYDKDLGGWMYFYETENGTRQGGDDVFRSFNEAKNALALNLDEENARAKARVKAKADQQQATQTQTQEQAAPILSSPETTTIALEQLPSEEKSMITFTQEDGTQTNLDGNEKALSDLFHAAQAIPEQDRTDAQQSAIDAIEVSLGEQAREQEQKTQEAEQQVNDETVYPMEYSSMEEVPVQFRDRVEEVPALEIEARRKVLGFIPIGKKVTRQVRGPVYRFNATGKELREANIEAVKPAEQAPVTTDMSTIFRNTAKSIASIFPDVKILNFKNAQEMEQYLKDNVTDGASTSMSGTGGVIIYGNDNKPSAILINEESSDATTLPHEAWHGILTKAFSDNEALFKEFRDEITKLLRDNGYEEIADGLDEFSRSQEYIDSDTQSQEWLVQLGALLTASPINARTISPEARTLLSKLKDLMNKFAMKITGQPMFLEDATPRDVLNYMVEISGAMSRGEGLERFFKSEETNKTGEGQRVSQQVQGNQASMPSRVQNIAKRYGFDVNGFASSKINDIALAKELSALGFGIKRSRTDGRGGGGSVYIVGPNGKFYNPFKVKSQKLSLTGGRLTPNIESIPGYDQMINILNDLVEKRKKLGDSNDAIMKKVLDVIVTLPAYTNANDSQREQLVRNVQTEFGKRLKSAPSVAKLLGTIKDITKITMSERELLKKQIRDMARGAKDAKKAWVIVSKELAKQIKQMALSGVITPRQMTSAITRLSKVNMFSQDSIDKFVDYMANVFSDAEYADKMDTANRLLPRARKNVSTKIGSANSIAPDLKRLFSIKPSMIPMSVLDRYIAIVEAFGQRTEVLTIPEVSQLEADVSDILFELDQEVSVAEEMAIRFENYMDKELDDDGNILYADTVAKMLEEDQITKEEAEIMRKYKSIIMPAAPKTPMTEQEIENEKNIIINGIRSNPIDSSVLSSRDERDLADKLLSLLKPELLKKMSIAQLNNIAKLIDLINNGYLPHFAELTVEKLEGIQDAALLVEASKQAKILKGVSIVASIKSIFTKKTAELEAIRRGPLYFMDQLFGNFKSKPIYNAVFAKMTQAQSLFDSSMNTINKKLDNAHNAVAKSYGYNANNTLASSFRMMTYMLQLEYESNPGSKQVNPASEFLKQTIAALRKDASKKSDAEADMLQDILDKYASNGEIDINKLYDSFNPAEINAIKEIRDINNELTEKASYTASVIRGKRIDPLVNYVHHFAKGNIKKDARLAATVLSQNYNSSMNPSTKAVTLIERQKKASPISFDVFASAQRGAKFTMLDYHMTAPIRTARTALNQAEAELDNDSSTTRSQRRLINAVSAAFEESLSNVLTNNFMSDTFVDEVINEMSKQGYRAVLASAPRFVSELSSNMGFAIIADPKSFTEGTKYRSIIMGSDGVLVMQNVRSGLTNRIYSGNSISGRLIDSSLLGQSSGVKSAGVKSDVTNITNMIYNMSLKKYKNFIEMTADALISTPDKLVMRPIWFGAFANEFKKVSGKEVDFEKIAANDETYIKENSDAIESATKVADDKAVLTGATDNPFMGILKGTRTADQGTLLKTFNNFNSFMTRFAIYEYTTARTGIYAAMGNGSISRKQGVALLAAVTTRMTVYTLLSSVLGNALISLFSDEDEEEDEKTFMQKLGQSLASTASSLMLGRDFGNFAKGMINYGVEEMNEEFLTDLREGEYDPYKDAIGYSFVPKPRPGHQVGLQDFAEQMSGPFGPSFKTGALIVKKMFEAPKKEQAAIERSKKETHIRIPLELLGNAGMVPLYRDVRKVVMDHMYKDLKNADKKAADKKEAKEEMLHGYENRTEMKRYDPKLYEEVFGSKSQGYNEKQAQEKIKNKLDRIEQERKDKIYNYTPKSEEKKGGFGSKKFGGSDSKSKGFGSKKFGGN